MPARKPNSTNGSWNVVSTSYGPAQPSCTVGVGAEHVVVREEVRGSRAARPLCAYGPHRADVGADLGLREHDSDLHRLGLSATGAHRSRGQPMPSIVSVTLKLLSSLTVTTEPSALVMWTS